MKNKRNPEIRLKRMMHLFVFILLIGGAVLRFPNVEAVEGYKRLEASIKVLINIERMPCDIKGKGPGGIINVDFGNDVMTTRIDGVYKSKPIEYTFNCGTDIESNQVKMQIVGDGASFDSNVLKTEQDDLGIAITSNGGRFPINQWLLFNYPNNPELMAVPVKAAGKTLSGGAFSAAATMKIEYQ